MPRKYYIPARLLPPNRRIKTQSSVEWEGRTFRNYWEMNSRPYTHAVIWRTPGSESAPFGSFWRAPRTWATFHKSAELAKAAANFRPEVVKVKILPTRIREFL